MFKVELSSGRTLEVINLTYRDNLVRFFLPNEITFWFNKDYVKKIINLEKGALSR